MHFLYDVFTPPLIQVYTEHEQCFQLLVSSQKCLTMWEHCKYMWEHHCRMWEQVFSRRFFDFPMPAANLSGCNDNAMHVHAISFNTYVDALCKAPAKCKTGVVILRSVAAQWNERSPLVSSYFTIMVLAWRSFSSKNAEVYETRALNRVLWSCSLDPEWVHLAK